MLGVGLAHNFIPRKRLTCRKAAEADVMLRMVSVRAPRNRRVLADSYTAGSRPCIRA